MPQPSLPPSETSPADPGTWGARLRDLLMLAAAGTAVEGARRALTQGDTALLFAASGPIATLAVVSVCRRLVRRQAPRLHGLAAARLLLYAFVAGAALAVWWVYPYQGRRLLIPLGAMLGLWAVAAEIGPRLAAVFPRRLLRRCDALLLTLALLVPLAEVGLRVIAAVFPSPLFAREDSESAARIRAHRCLPGEVRYGFPCNAHGCYDEEFAPKRPGELNVVAVGDSFGAGVVPHEFHFTTVCERLLPACRVQNLGVPATGPAEYVQMLETIGLPLRPDLVVIGLFLGNDLEGRSPSFLQGIFDRGSLLVCQVPWRLWMLSRTAWAESRPALRGATVPAAEYAAANPWVLDPMLERPTLSDDVFLRVEAERAQLACARNDKSEAAYRHLFANLRTLQRSAGSVPLLFLLIPDEFQVEDWLWGRVGGEELERDQPQRRVRAWLEQRGIPYVDLLPRLRAVPPLADGRRHVFHRSDTHFNTRGNRMAGEALAEAVARVAPRPR
jgi:hypothetical protein